MLYSPKTSPVVWFVTVTVVWSASITTRSPAKALPIPSLWSVPALLSVTFPVESIRSYLTLKCSSNTPMRGLALMESFDFPLGLRVVWAAILLQNTQVG